MKRSLNEIEVAMRRASIGAGLPVGLAQDLSAAAAWLVARGLDGAGALAALLPHADRKPCVAGDEDGATVFNDGRIEVCGPSAIDLLLTGQDGSKVTIKNANSPLMLAGLAGVAAVQHGAAFEIVCDGTTVDISPDTLGFDASALQPGGNVTLSCSQMDEETGPASPDLNGFVVAETAWSTIAEYAGKTFVPATDASRLTGAGAGLTDND